MKRQEIRWISFAIVTTCSLFPSEIVLIMTMVTVMIVAPSYASTTSITRSSQSPRKRQQLDEIKQQLFWNEIELPSPVIQSPMGELADSFGNNIIVTSMDGKDEIDMEQLLKACHKFENVMRFVGQTQSAKDLENNIQKVTNLFYTTSIDQRRTMSSLLQHEKAMGIHPDLSNEIEDNPQHAGEQKMRLKDPSCAIGLLWIRRSLQFNCRWYSNILENSLPPLEAAMDAYREELEPYHGWALRRLYVLGIQKMTPPRKELFASLWGRSSLSNDDEKIMEHDIHRLLSVWRPLIARWKSTFCELSMDDRRRV